MGDIFPTIILILVLIGLNAIFAGSELAIVSLRQSQLRRMREKHGAAADRLAELAEDPSRFLSTVQVGITLGGFLASATAAVSLAKPLVPHLGFLGDAADVVSVVIITLILTFFTLVLGELVPKRIALQRAEGWAMRVARPLSLLSRVASPVVWLLSSTTDALVRLLGGSVDPAGPDMTEGEIRDLIAHQPGLGAVRKAMLEGAFEIQDRVVRDILTPRRDVCFLDSGALVPAAIGQLVDAGHSRAPVVRDDDPVGVVHLRDLVACAIPDGPVADCMRPVLIVPETARVLDVLRQFQSDRQQLAVVADEYGSVAGIVTIEDVLEEIVGEIYDEFDRDLNEGDMRSVQREPDGSLVVPGAFPLHDLDDLGIHVADSEQVTIAGFVIDQLQHIPSAGETLKVPGWTITVLEVERHAINRLGLRPDR